MVSAPVSILVSSGGIVCSNDDPGVILTYFTARSNGNLGFSLGKSEKSGFFRKY